VWDLLKCREDQRPDDAYDALKTVTKGLHLLMRQFLLDPPAAPPTCRTRERTRKVSLFTNPL
jgi:hypothetical protein